MAPRAGDGLLRLVLRRGSVFYFQHRHLKSPEPHYLIVLNTVPLTDRCLVLAVPSSQVDKVRQRRQDQPAVTLVEVSPADYPDFTKPSIIDCNSLLELDRQTLGRQLDAEPRAQRRDLPAPVLEAVIAGVLASRLVTGEQKRLVSLATHGPKKANE